MFKPEIQFEQLKVLYGWQKIGVTSGLVLACIFVYVLSAVIAPALLLAWFVSLCLVAALRLLDGRAYARDNTDESAQRWLLRFRLGVTATALIWGASAWLLFPENLIEYQVFLGFALAGLGISVAVSYAVDLYSAMVFFTLIIVPFMLRMFINLEEFAVMISISMVWFLSFVFVGMRRANVYIRDNMLLRLNANRRTQVLQNSEVRFRQMFERPLTPMLLIDPMAGQVVEANAAASRFYGYSMQQMRNQEMAEIELDCHSSSINDDLEHRIAVHRLSDGQRRSVELYISALNVDGRELQFAIIHDITDRMRMEAEVHQLAYYDPLTALANRTLFYTNLQFVFEQVKHQLDHACLMCIDLDQFNHINDTQGHDVGNKVIIEAAVRLRRCVGETASLGRLGGDEFVVLLSGLDEDTELAQQQAATLAEKIRATLALPYYLGSAIPLHTDSMMTQYCSASIGVTFIHASAGSVSDLLKCADVAMHQAKKAGRNTVRFFDQSMQISLDTHARLNVELRNALKHKQFVLHYQVQVDSQHRPIGAEALVRWQHPQRGMQSPDSFIPHAEQTGLIVSLGLWVLREACTQLQKWQQHALTRDLVLAVNVSAKQFHQTDFIEQVQKILADTRINTARLKLELTESAVLGNIEDTISKMEQLRGMGIHFSMDDFGTGYSSLQYLKRLPFDQVKIDRSFIRDLATDANDAAIVQAVIAMTQALNIEVIAEGVETAAQRDFLMAKGCHLFQGYLFSKPVPIEQFDKSLQETLQQRLFH
ncbi:MAG: EAL domain-containing protein [Sideroxydans sp.]|nr:EAL domain-containing protein [Sideroxydans sp.]